jgi:uncharacterized protein YndB with AHSA1/START domain
MNMPTSEPEFTITRTLNARRELVWRAWTEKKELAAWLPSTPLESISFDVREGGRYRYTMVNVETGEEYPTGGVFLDVVPFERLVFTWGYPDAPIEDSPGRDPDPHRTRRPHRDDLPPARMRRSPRRSVLLRRLVRSAQQSDDAPARPEAVDGEQEQRWSHHGSSHRRTDPLRRRLLARCLRRHGPSHTGRLRWRIRRPSHGIRCPIGTPDVTATVVAGYRRTSSVMQTSCEI